MNISQPKPNSPPSWFIWRSNSMGFVASMIAGCALIGVAAVHDAAPFIVWNGSASMALGAYVRTIAPLRQGDRVLSGLPRSAQQLVDQRRYLPAGIPVLKRIAAMQGDRVCRHGKSLFVNGKLQARAMQTDSAQRPMPVWQGCWLLKADDVLLLADNPRSFDGRYFGVTSTRLIIGKYRPLWMYE
jgi:conjugative transfer signal peptidase TraF